MFNFVTVLYVAVDSEEITLDYIVNLQLRAGKALSGPPLGPILGQCGIPAAPFCTLFNERTSLFFKPGLTVAVDIYIFSNGEYDFDLKFPNITYQIKRLLKTSLLSKKPGRFFIDRFRFAEEINVVPYYKVQRTIEFKCISLYALFEIFLYNVVHRDTINSALSFSFCKQVKGTLQSAGL